MTWQTIATPFIQGFESRSLTAYHGAADAPGVWTIGWGETGPDIHEGLVWTQEEADAAFAVKLESLGAEVDGMVYMPLNDNQKAALVSFAYNLGAGALNGSTLLLMLNGGNYKAASEQFTNWVHADGVVVPGLVRRRQAEAALFEAMPS